MSRSALVTGGTGAVGSAVVSHLRALGVPTWFTWHRSAEAAAALEQTGARGLQLDLRDPDAIDATIARLRASGTAPDAWVQAAGVRSRARLPDLDAAARAEALSVHVDGPLALLRALAPGMPQGGDVVLVGGLDRGQSAPMPVHLAAAQGAVAALAMAAAHELGPAGVRINVVTLGLLADGMGREVEPELREDYLEHSALRRMGTAAEAARTITWLLLHNTYMSGRVLAANGGL